jgi:hypothetical protein
MPGLGSTGSLHPEKGVMSSEERVVPKPTKANGTASTGTNMVFVLPSEFYAPDRKELPVAQLDFGPRLVIFEKPREKNYKDLKVCTSRVISTVIRLKRCWSTPVQQLI